MKRSLLINFLCATALMFSSCKKEGDAVPIDPLGPTGNDTIVPPIHYDSVFVLTNTTRWNGGVCNFTYDTAAKRYSNFYFRYSANNWDSTFINYNANGTILNLVEKFSNPPYYSFRPTVLQYNSAGQLAKIYKKRQLDQYQYTSNAYFTDISDPNTISYYDSLNYDNKNRITSSYRVYYEIYNLPYYVTFYRKFYYQATNDSLLSKIELYDRDNAGNFRLKESFGFNQFDNKPNPFFKGFALYGLCTPYVTKFYSQPDTHSSELSDFLTGTPQNCNEVAISNPLSSYSFNSKVNYTYNADGLPIKVTYAMGDPTEYVQFSYKKVRK